MSSSKELSNTNFQNKIIFSGLPLATMSFDVETKNILIVSSGSSIPSSRNAAIYLVKLWNGTNNTLKAKSSIDYNANGSKFARDLSGTVFNFGDFLEIQIRDNNTIEITNFPNIYDIHLVRTPLGETIKVFIKITKDGLQLFTPMPLPTIPKLSNVIIIKNLQNQTPMVDISFNTLDKILDFSYFKNFNTDFNNYFNLKFIKKNGTTIVRRLGRRGTDDAYLFTTSFSNLFFNYGDQIEFNFTGGSRPPITITNFPNQRENYTPIKLIETYTITTNGLIPYTRVINGLENIIIIKGVDNDTVLDIQFDKSNKKIIANYTGGITDPAGGPNYFKFTLYQTDGTTEKITDTIGGNSNGINFSNIISNTDFQTGDIITLQTASNNKVIITNFPDISTPRFFISTGEQNLKIGDTRLFPHIRSEIIFSAIATMSFNGEDRKILVVSNITAVPMQILAIFLVKLRDGTDNNIIKANSLIESSSNGSKFAQDLNNTSFNFGDIIEIQIRNNQDISITNFPNISNTERIFAPTNQPIKKFVKITETGLQLFTPTPMPTTPKLLNDIIIKRLSDKVPMIGISFNTLDKILDILYFQGNSVSDNYFTLKFIRNDRAIVQHTLGAGGTFGTETFIGNFTNLFFNYGDKLEFTFTGEDKSSVTITNFPNKGQDYTPVNRNETYEITPKGLILYEGPDSKLPNDIVINKPDGSRFGTIFFNTATNKFLLSGFKGQYDSSSNYKVLEFKLYHSNLSRPINITLNSQDDPTTFLNAINNKDFGNSYYLELGYSEESKGNITITNFPNPSVVHTPTVVREYYKINLPTGFTTHTPRMKTFYFINGTTTIATLTFESINKKLIAKQLVDPIPAGFIISVTTKYTQNGVVSKVVDYASDEDGNFEKNIFRRKFPYKGLETNEFDYVDFAIDISSKEQIFDILGFRS